MCQFNSSNSRDRNFDSYDVSKVFSNEIMIPLGLAIGFFALYKWSKWKYKCYREPENLPENYPQDLCSGTRRYRDYEMTRTDYV